MIRSKLKKILKSSFNDKTRGNWIGKILLWFYLLYRKLDEFLYKRNNRTVSKAYIRMKNIERRLMTKCTFVSYEELLIWTNDWIKTFPDNYDIIVGIPRSGLLVANIIAGKLGKPLSTPDKLKDGEYWVGGHMEDIMDEEKEITSVLLVDDCLRNESTIEKPAQVLRSSNNNLKITRAALLVSEDAVRYVDIYYKKISAYPPIGEWNLLHWKRGILAVDLDGVVCEDCPTHVDLNDKLYEDWISNARPYLIPLYEIDYIISSRLEKYRAATEEWLTRHNVRYKELILWDIPSKDRRGDGFAQCKIDALLRIKPAVYWESSYNQAKQIWEATKIPTICIDEMVAFGVLGSR